MEKYTEFKNSIRIFFSKPSVIIGFIIFMFYVIDTLIVQLTPWMLGIQNPNVLQLNFINTVPQPPSLQHPFGTTASGIDLLNAIEAAIRIDLYYSLVIVFTVAVIGSIIGLLSGYIGGLLDDVLMRITDVFFAIPYLLLTIAVSFVLGRNFESMAIALIIVWWPLYARYARGQTLSIKRSPFIDASKIAGLSDFKIMIKHILPNVLPFIFVQISLDLGAVMVIFSTLTFIGLIPDVQTPELGYLTSLGLGYIQTAPWAVFFPAVTIALFTLSVTLIGDRLRDMVDPKRRS